MKVTPLIIKEIDCLLERIRSGAFKVDPNITVITEKIEENAVTEIGIEPNSVTTSVTWYVTNKEDIER